MSLPTSTFTLDADGYFRQDGFRIFPAGVNYWPASSGLRMWAQWDADEVAGDLDLVRRLGLNTVRFFLRWQDFEPVAGRYDEVQFVRLDWMLAECAARGLYAQPSLFVGWMSGGIFWPEWKKDRNVFSDPFMAERSEAFARRAAQVFARHRASLIAIDLGNEMGCLPDAKVSSYATIATWCSRVCAAAKAECPGMLIVSGCDMGQVTSDSPWAFDNQPGTDFFSIHAYPVANWAPVPLAGLEDPLSRRLFACYCAYARAYGPVLFQEFATFLTLGDKSQRDFLAEALPAVAATAANGMLWWCLHDIHSTEHPYGLCEQERSLGLVDSEGCVKPPLAAAVRQLAGWAANPASLPEIPAAEVAFYIPDLTRPLAPDYLRHPNPQSLLGRRYLIAWHLAHEANFTPAFVKSSALPTPGSIPLIFAGSSLMPDEIKRLTSWVRAGGHLILHGVTCRNWGGELSALLGARAVSYALNTTVTVEFADTTWHFPPSPDEVRFVVEPTTAETIARDQDGNPVVLRQTHGEGLITCCLPSPEDAACHDRARSLAVGDRWRAWFAAMLTEVPIRS